MDVQYLFLPEIFTRDLLSLMLVGTDKSFSFNSNAIVLFSFNLAFQIYSMLHSKH